MSSFVFFTLNSCISFQYERRVFATIAAISFIEYEFLDATMV